MKKVISFCLILALLVALSVGAAASGDPEAFGDATQYSELAAALATTGSVITIYPEWGEGDQKTYFHDTWPTEPVTVELKAANPAATIYLGNGTLIVPDNVTIQAHDTLHFGSPDFREQLVLNGTWTMMTNQGYLGGVSGDGVFYGQVTVGSTGKVVVSEQLNTAQPFWVGKVSMDGTLQCDSDTIVEDMTLGSNARILGKQDLLLKGSLAGPETGTVTIENTAVVRSDFAALSGNLQVKKLYMNNHNTLQLSAGNMTFEELSVREGSTLRLAAGSKVEIQDLYISNGALEIEAGAELTVRDLKLYNLATPVELAGTLECTGVYSSISNTDIQMNGGTLILRPGNSFGNRQGTDSMKGTGTIKLYGELTEDGSVENVPILYGLSTQWNDREAFTKVDEDIVFWKNWVDAAGCLHNWIRGDVSVPTCGMDGYTTYTCDVCQSTKKGDLVDATGEHVLHSDYEDGLPRQSCAKCDYLVYTYIYDENLIVEVPQLETGDHAVAALYASSGKLIGFDEVTMKQDGVAGLELPTELPEEAHTLKIFALKGTYEAKRAMGEFSITLSGGD